MDRHRYKGFSLAEILIIIAVITLTVVVALPIGLNQLDKEETVTSVESLVSNIFNAQQNSYSGRDSGYFGIKIGSDSYHLYEGPSYQGSTWSQEFALMKGVEISTYDLGGGDELQFIQGSVLPTSSGYIEVTDGLATYRVTINSEGSIDVVKQ